MKDEILALALAAMTLLIPITMFAAWLTHVIVCISTEMWLFLIAGAVFFPIGIIHGIGYWFGFF